MGVVLVVVAAVAGAVVAVLGGSELAHWIASHRHIGNRHVPDRPASEVVVVLGRSGRRDGRPHPAQVWRTDIAIRSVSAYCAGPPSTAERAAVAGAAERARTGNSLLVFTGGVTSDSPLSEAEMMANFARQARGVRPGLIVEERQARSTWENLTLTTPFLESADVIKIVSSPMHAARARRYMRALRPDLHRRVVRAADYRFLERPGQKLSSLLYELTRPVLRHVVPRVRAAWQRRRTRER